MVPSSADETEAIILIFENKTLAKGSYIIDFSKSNNLKTSNAGRKPKQEDVMNLATWKNETVKRILKEHGYSHKGNKYKIAERAQKIYINLKKQTVIQKEVSNKRISSQIFFTNMEEYDCLCCDEETMTICYEVKGFNSCTDEGCSENCCLFCFFPHTFVSYTCGIDSTFCSRSFSFLYFLPWFIIFIILFIIQNNLSSVCYHCIRVYYLRNYT